MNTSGVLLPSDTGQEQSVVFFAVGFSVCGGVMENVTLGSTVLHDGRVSSEMLCLAVVAPGRINSITAISPPHSVPISVPFVPTRAPPSLTPLPRANCSLLPLPEPKPPPLPPPQPPLKFRPIPVALQNAPANGVRHRQTLSWR